MKKLIKIQTQLSWNVTIVCFCSSIHLGTLTVYFSDFKLKSDNGNSQKGKNGAALKFCLDHFFEWS